tara:strand:- start:22024 stop:22590 length:567 start_codon:yes stop_codon:yes gene_type:complete
MLLISSASLAQHQHEIYSGDKATTPSGHTHGVAELVVVLEGDQLEIELRSPAVNILGFEHHILTPEQLTTLEHTRKTLADADSLFQFDPALCQITDHSADFGTETTANTHNGDGNTNDVHGKHLETHRHTNIEVRYRYRCQQPDELQSLSASLSDEFPGIQVLQVQWIVGGRQGAITLDNDQRRILFR